MRLGGICWNTGPCEHMLLAWRDDVSWASAGDMSLCRVVYRGETWAIQNVPFSCDPDSSIRILMLCQHQNFPGLSYHASPNHAARIVPSLRNMRPNLLQKPNLWSSWTNVRWSFRRLSMKTWRTDLGDCRTSMTPQQVLSAVCRTCRCSLAYSECSEYIALVNPLWLSSSDLSFGAGKKEKVRFIGEGSWCRRVLLPWSPSARLKVTPTSCVPLGSLLASLCPLKNESHNTYPT